MKSLLLATVTLFGSLNAFAQECPNGICPNLAPRKPSLAAQSAIQAVAVTTFTDLQKVEFDYVGVRETTANFVDNTAASASRSDLSYEHVSAKIFLKNGTTLDCNRIVVTTNSKNLTNVKFRSCKVN